MKVESLQVFDLGKISEIYGKFIFCCHDVRTNARSLRESSVLEGI